MLDTGYWMPDTRYWMPDARCITYVWNWKLTDLPEKLIKKEVVMSYKNLEIWKLSRDLVVDIHQMTINQLPKFETFEEGAQIRRSMKSVKSNIVEGYGRRVYKNKFIRFIIFALASADETIDHLETLIETGSLNDTLLYEDLHERLNTLSKMINNFLKAIQSDHLSRK